jgi:hypothetical protein
MVFFSINYLYADSKITAERVLYIVVDGICFKFHEVNNRLPVSFDDFLENLPRRRNSSEADIHGLIDSFTTMGFIITYILTDENDFELTVRKGNEKIIYNSNTDEVFHYENEIIINIWKKSDIY